MTVLGIGLDLVDLVGFASQLDDTASGFVDATFTAGERSDVAASGPRRTASLAARFAAKEALIKAWSGARFGNPPAQVEVDPLEIEVVVDGWHRPSLRLHGAVAGSVAALAPESLVVAQVSLTHDGPTAGAVVILEAHPPPRAVPP